TVRERFPDLPRRISGYNLPTLLPEHGMNVAQALVGSESTCVTILRAELALLPEPRHVVLVLAGYPDIATAADHVPLVNKHEPYIVEGLDHKLIEYERDRRLNTVALHELPDAGAWLMVKVTGDSPEEASDKASKLLGALDKDGDLVSSKILEDEEHQAELDSVREAALGATARVPGMPDTWPGWEDSAVPPDRVGAYLRALQKLLDEYGYGAASLYGHFGDGCAHTSIPFDLVSAEGIRNFRSFVTRAAHLVVEYGGSLSGEHGDGQARGELLSIMYGDELVGAFGEFKAIFDPGNRMNPGKMVNANPLDGQLRLGVDWRPPAEPTQFEYPRDGGFMGVPTRCFGVGACRRHSTDEGGVMCPSYMVTGEEQHSTRGRMRLIFEMMRGETIKDGWRSKAVHESLDLCLACKGCKTDCPVNVDMATYKAEFLFHHYARRMRPRAHYSLGWLPLWARFAARAPWLANATTQTPGLRAVAKLLAGVDRRRAVPRFAKRRFTDAWRSDHAPELPPPAARAPLSATVDWPTGATGQTGAAGSRSSQADGSGPRTVVLWPDTFTNSLSPHIAHAAVTVLEAAGFEIVVPEEPVCCGLTWISTGQLTRAKKELRRSLDVLKPYLDAGLPVVGLEPSCTSVLRGDAVDLLGGDIEAKQLKDSTVTLAELLRDRAPGFAPRLSTVAGAAPKAVVQTHCHQHAIMGFAADAEVMKRAGIDAEVLSSGCCGLAGDFGMTADHHDVSIACAERVLLPAVRDADPATIVMADGFSCRTQIDGAGTGRRAVHLAEVLAAAVEGVAVGPLPEDSLGQRP
ncbi:MAG TPA: FAD-linked oxidase C-terminal domain-containing protein, partial [Micromonosporaceae bacterium]|nr:FAD-linked oxidase C-terminal domain-containing protein [Micromonosporaceae bacterium]